MKKHYVTILKPVMPLVFGMLGANLVYANEIPLAEMHAQYGISAEPDEEGYYVIYRPKCGTHLGGGTEQRKYKLGRSVTCESGNSSGAAFTLVGEETIFNLNGKVINCAADIGAFHTGVQLAGTRGELTNSHPHNRKGRIINCETGVIVGSEASPDTSIDNKVHHLQVEVCNTGFQIVSNKNTVFENLAMCGNQGNSIGFLLGDIRKSATNTLLHSNILQENIARDNTIGFADQNQGEPAHSHVENNIIRRNMAEYNSGDGFFIDGAGGLYRFNIAKQNGGNGYNYTYSHDDTRKLAVLANIQGNLAVYNDENGFVASFLTANSANNGAYFKRNYSFYNGLVSGFDLFDENLDCAVYSEIYILNQWDNNVGFTFNPPCTGGR
jgi:hypothetical protein